MKPFIQMESTGHAIIFKVEINGDKYGCKIKINNSWSFQELGIYCQQARYTIARHVFTKHQIHLENISLHFTYLFDRETNMKIINHTLTEFEIQKLFEDKGCLQYFHLVPSFFYKK